MHKFYPVNKGRFSVCLVCMIIAEILSFFSFDFLCETSWKNFFLFHVKLSLEKVKKSKIIIYTELKCLFSAADFKLFSGVFVSLICVSL